MSPLEDAIQRAGGLTRFAKSIGTTPQNATHWRSRGVPVERCPDIERETGVPCELLRPDVEWGVLRRGGREGSTSHQPSEAANV